MSNVPTPEKSQDPSRVAQTIGEQPEAQGTLLTDGGSDDNNDNNNEDDSGNNEGDETGNDDGTRVIYLDVEGLFLDILGLEVDLNEVVLDVSAVPGSGNLLGNLLSAVAGLFDDGLSDMLSGLLPDDILSTILPDDVLDDMSVSDSVFGCINYILDVLLDAVEDGESGDKSPSDPS